MILLQQFRSFIITMGLTLMLAITIGFDFGTASSWAATSFTQPIPQPQSQLATMNRIDAITKNLEGKAQEAMGNITGDPKDQAMGKAKQVESQVRNAAEDVKDKMRQDQMNLKKQAKAVTKKIGDKIDDARN